MSREWKPGDVAKFMGGIGFRTDREWRYNDSSAHSAEVGDKFNPRPLVVIDPEDRKAVERLEDDLAQRMGWLRSSGAIAPGFRVDALQAALREFADPKPPKPDEPTGLGAVVEDAEGEWWVLAPLGPGLSEWVCGHSTATWNAIDAVKVLSEGVAP